MQHRFTTYTTRLVKETVGTYPTSNRMKSAKDIHQVMTQVIRLHECPEENLYGLYLNTKNVIIGIQMISKGTLNASLVHPREVLRGAILANACGMIICHNHPSGNCEPSVTDTNVTANIKQACALMGIPLLDHVVIAENEYFSYRDQNRL